MTSGRCFFVCVHLPRADGARTVVSVGCTCCDAVCTCSRGRLCGDGTEPWPCAHLAHPKVKHCLRPVRADGLRARAAASARTGADNCAATRNPHQMRTLDMTQHDHAVFLAKSNIASLLNSNGRSCSCDVTTPEPSPFTVSWNCDRNDSDVRICHDKTLAVNNFCAESGQAKQRNGWAEKLMKWIEMKMKKFKNMFLLQSMSGQWRVGIWWFCEIQNKKIGDSFLSVNSLRSQCRSHQINGKGQRHFPEGLPSPERQSPPLRLQSSWMSK